MNDSKIHAECTATRVDLPSNGKIKKVTKRDLSAYLDYVAVHLGNLNYRLMNLSERGFGGAS